MRLTKVSFLMLALVMALVGFGEAASVQASPAHQAATPTPAAFTIGQLLQIKPTIPYSWLRNLPNSAAPSVDTAASSEFVIVASPVPQYDGSQWWWAVRRGTGNVTGWVEENSLQVAIAPTSTMSSGMVAPTATAAAPAATTASSSAAQSWAVGSTVAVAPGVPYIWLRATASSAGVIRATAYHGALLTIRSAQPTNDGTQNWWQINFPALNVFGWVEQNSLVAVAAPAIATGNATAAATSTLAPTLEPSATIAPATAQPATEAATWGVPSIVRVRAAVPFVWIRPKPSSSATISGTVLSGTLLLVTDSPQSDGTQYWWPVQASGKLSGWVEQSSLELIVSLSASGASDNSAAASPTPDNSAPLATMPATPANG